MYNILVASVKRDINIRLKLFDKSFKSELTYLSRTHRKLKRNAIANIFLATWIQCDYFALIIIF